MKREGELLPRITTQASNPSEKEKGMWWPPLSPLLTPSQAFTHHGEETGKAALAVLPIPSTPIIPYASLGPALPSWLPWHPCPSLPCPRPHPHPQPGVALTHRWPCPDSWGGSM